MADENTTEFVRQKFEKLLKEVRKYTADQQAKLIHRWFFRRYNKSECCATAGVLIGAAILLLSWLLNKFMPHCVVPMLIRLALALFALWWALGAFSYPLEVVLVNLPKNGTLKSPTRSILLFFFNYVEITIHFASVYLLSSSIGYSSCQNPITCPLDALYFSIVTITTLGYGDIRPISWIGRILISFEVLIGVVLIVVVLGVFLQLAMQQKNKGDKRTERQGRQG